MDLVDRSVKEARSWIENAVQDGAPVAAIEVAKETVVARGASVLVTFVDCDGNSATAEARDSEIARARATSMLRGPATASRGVGRPPGRDSDALTHVLRALRIAGREASFRDAVRMIWPQQPHDWYTRTVTRLRGTLKSRRRSSRRAGDDADGDNLLSTAMRRRETDDRIRAILRELDGDPIRIDLVHRLWIEATATELSAANGFDLRQAMTTYRYIDKRLRRELRAAVSNVADSVPAAIRHIPMKFLIRLCELEAFASES